MTDVSLTVACRDPKLLGAVPFHPRQMDLLRTIEEHETTIVSAGRRAGKSRCGAAVAVHSLLLYDKLDRLVAPHEPRYVVCVANSQEQASIFLGLAASLVKTSSVLRGELVGESATELTFRRGRILRALPCNARTIRGLPASVVILDEAGHFYDEGSGPQVAEKIWAALTPSVAQFQGEGRIVATSTPGDDSGLSQVSQGTTRIHVRPVREQVHGDKTS